MPHSEWARRESGSSDGTVTEAGVQGAERFPTVCLHWKDVMAPRGSAGGLVTQGLSVVGIS